jgi:hypothetical protein
MRSRILLVSLSLCLSTGLIALAPGAALAQVTGPQTDVPPVSDAPPGQESVQRGVQGPEGMLHARVLLHMNTSSDRVGEPISLAPDLYYAFSDTFQAGIVHNLPMGWLTRPGAGICMTGTPGCRKVYDNVGLDTMLGLAFGDFNFSLHTGLYALQIAEPTFVMFTIGAATKFHFGETVALFIDPQIGLAISERDGGNEDLLFLPAELQFQLSDPLVLKILSGVWGPLDSLSDNAQVPLGLGLIGNISSGLDLGLRFSFDNLLGPQPTGQDRTDLSSLALLLHLRFD